MERLRQRLEAAEKALAAFEKLATLKNPNDVERDAAINDLHSLSRPVGKRRSNIYMT